MLHRPFFFGTSVEPYTADIVRPDAFNAAGDSRTGLEPFPSKTPETEPSDRAVNLPEGLTRSKVLSWAKQRKQKFLTWAKPEFSRIENNHKIFENQHVAQTIKPGVFVPLANSIIETDTAKRTMFMFSKSKVVEAIPNFITQDNEATSAVEDFINQEILYLCRTPEKGFDALKGQAIEGTGIAKSYWEYVETIEKVPDFQRNPITGQSVQVGEREVATRKGRWNWEPVAIQSMGWEPRLSTRIQDSPWVFHHSKMSLNELLHKQENGEIEGVEKLSSLAASGPGQPSDLEAQRKVNLGEQNITTDEDEATYDVTEWHAELSWKKPNSDNPSEFTFQKERFKFWIVNDEVLVKFEVNPLEPKRNPYFSYRYQIRPRRFLGNPLTQSILYMQAYVNNLFGTLQDLIRKASQNPTFYEKTTGLEGRRTLLTENSLIPVLNSDRLKHFPVDVGAISATKGMLIDTVNLVRESVAANEQAQGIPTQSGTATEASLLFQSSATRFQNVVELTYHEFFAAMAQECFWFYRQFGQDGEMFVRNSSLDGNSRNLTRDELQNEFIFTPAGTFTESNKIGLLKTRTEYISMLAKMFSENPALFMDNNGMQMKFDFVSYFIQEDMPLLGIKNGKTYWLQSPPMPPAPAMAGASSSGGGVSQSSITPPPSMPPNPAQNPLSEESQPVYRLPMVQAAQG